MNFDKIIQPRRRVIHDVCNHGLIFTAVISDLHSSREYFFKFFIRLFDFGFRFFCRAMLLCINIILFLFRYFVCNSIYWRSCRCCRCQLFSRSCFLGRCRCCRTLLQRILNSLKTNQTLDDYRSYCSRQLGKQFIDSNCV